MNLAITVIQTLSAFVIFATGFFALLVVTICGLVLASGIYKGGQLMKAYSVRNVRID